MIQSANTVLAKAWYLLHSNECHKALLDYWMKRFPYCPIQAALIYTHYSNDLTSINQEYIEKSKQLWIQYHQEEFQRLKLNNEHAKLVLFESLFPTIESKRDAIQRKILKSNFYFEDPMLYHLTQIQKDTITSVINKFSQEDYECCKFNDKYYQIESNAHKYLILFGHTTAGLIESKVTVSNGIISSQKIQTINENEHTFTTPFGNIFQFEVGTIVSSLLAKHQGSLGIITHYYDEDNSYDVRWNYSNEVERLQRNYLKQKGKGKMFVPKAPCSAEQMKMFRGLLKHFYNLLTQPQSSFNYNISSNEESKSSNESNLSLVQQQYLNEWIQRCHQFGITEYSEYLNLSKIIEYFKIDGGSSLFLINIEESLPENYPLHLLRWKDLYGAILYYLSTTKLHH